MNVENNPENEPLLKKPKVRRYTGRNHCLTRRTEAPVAVAVACDVPDPPAQEGLRWRAMGRGVGWGAAYCECGRRNC